MKFYIKMVSLGLIKRGIRVYNERGLLEFFKSLKDFIIFKFYINIAQPIISILPVFLIRNLYNIKLKVLPWTTDKNPVDLVYIDPELIVYDSRVDDPKSYGTVKGGEWDKKERKKFERKKIYRSVRDAIIGDKEWENTEYYDYLVRMIDLNKPERRCKTNEQIKEYFRDIEGLYNSIKSEGYKSQRQLKEEGVDVRSGNNDTIHYALNEIAVNIHRDGAVSKIRTGRHRLIIAKILGVEKVPVIVRVRHRKWQDLRDEVRKADSKDELSQKAIKNLDHPDLRDINNF